MLDGLIAAGKTLIGNQILPNGHGIAATSQSLLDELAIRFACTGGAVESLQEVFGSRASWPHPFGIESRQARVDCKTAKGYVLSGLETAFACCPEPKRRHAK